MTVALGDAHVVQIVAWFGAFWVAVLGRGPTHADGPRLVLGLALGALLAVLGDQAFRPGDLGFSVLFVPLGLLVAAAFRSTAERRDACLRDSLRGLPAALALARVGCLAAGCCQPVPAQIAALVVLQWGQGRLPADYRAAFILGGLGAARLLVEPFRTPVPGPIEPAWVAAPRGRRRSPRRPLSA